MVSAIVCINNKNGIGKDNNLLYHIPSDMKHFKELTTGNVIICGRKTYESFPKRPLPNRFNIVLTSEADRYPDVYKEMKDGSIITTIEDVKVFLIMSKKDESSNVFIIGGGQIYKELLPYCDRLYITRVDDDSDADTFFPDINENEWYIDKCSEWYTDGGEYIGCPSEFRFNVSYRFEEYSRIKE